MTPQPPLPSRETSIYLSPQMVTTHMTTHLISPSMVMAGRIRDKTEMAMLTISLSVLRPTLAFHTKVEKFSTS